VARAGDRRSHISIRDPRLAYAIVQRANHLMMKIVHETMTLTEGSAVPGEK